MNNANKPINSCIEEIGRNGWGEKVNHHHKGLTKREYFAGLAMQGMLTNRAYRLTPSTEMAKKAVLDADELLKALEENK